MPAVNDGGIKMKIQWSYSKLKTFDTCPRKYQAEYVTKEVVFTETEATRYGTALHKAAENYVSKNVEPPKEFAFIKPSLDKLIAYKGDKQCETKLGIKFKNKKLEYCDFFDNNVWYRGIADLVILDLPNGIARLIDYKTSKNSRYADKRQLALMAATLFLKYPELHTVKAALLFVISKELITAEYTFNKRFAIFAELHPLLQQLEVAHKTNIFNPKQNGLCRKWCGVTSCPHNGE